MIKANVLGEGSCYHRVRDRKWTAMLLMRQAHRMFDSVDLYKYLNYLKLIWNDREAGAKLLKIGTKINIVLDAIKILACFEIAFKAELLNSGYVIHLVDSNKRLDLSKQQKKIPIKICEIKKSENNIKKKSNEYSFETLTDKTLKFSTLLDAEGYKMVLKYPKRVYKILQRINGTRNSIHFINRSGFRIDESVLDDYEYLKKMVEKKIVHKHNVLARQGKRFGYYTTGPIKF